MHRDPRRLAVADPQLVWDAYEDLGNEAVERTATVSGWGVEGSSAGSDIICLTLRPDLLSNQMSCANICLQIRLRATGILVNAAPFARQCANIW
jgi:hypothetical protein